MLETAPISDKSTAMFLGFAFVVLRVNVKAVSEFSYSSEPTFSRQLLTTLIALVAYPHHFQDDIILSSFRQ